MDTLLNRLEGDRFGISRAYVDAGLNHKCMSCLNYESGGNACIAGKQPAGCGTGSDTNNLTGYRPLNASVCWTGSFPGGSLAETNAPGLAVKAQLDWIEAGDEAMEKSAVQFSGVVTDEDRAAAPFDAWGLEKGEGEGTRGGTVIGHTSSGKPIYAPKTSRESLTVNAQTGKKAPKSDYHKIHHNTHVHEYGEQDHKDAAAHHRKAAAAASARGHSKKNAAHHAVMQQHENQAGYIRRNAANQAPLQGYNDPSAIAARTARSSGGYGKSLEKGEGEGSRGGTVIGHTASGKPIYASHNDHDTRGQTQKQAAKHGNWDTHHAGYRKQDHDDAAALHGKLADKHYKAGNGDAANYHGKQQEQHEAYAKREISHGFEFSSHKEAKAAVAAGKNVGKSTDPAVALQHAVDVIDLSLAGAYTNAQARLVKSCPVHKAGSPFEKAYVAYGSPLEASCVCRRVPVGAVAEVVRKSLQGSTDALFVAGCRLLQPTLGTFITRLSALKPSLDSNVG